MNDPGWHRSLFCSRHHADERRYARGEQAELVAALDAETFASVQGLLPGVKPRTWFQAQFMAAALLSLMEVADHPVAAVSSGALGIQAGRPRQQVVEGLRPMLDLGVLKVLDRGNDNGDRHGVPGEGYRAAKYANGDIYKLPAARSRRDERVQARVHEAEEARAFDRMMVDRWCAHQEENSPEWTRWDDGGWGRPPAPAPSYPLEVDEMPWYGQGADSSKLGCHGPVTSVHVFSSIEGMVVPLPFFEYEEGSLKGRYDNPACAAVAPTPVWYLTWSDAFGDDEAGVLGWVLACKQVRFTDDGTVDHLDALGTVTGTRIAKLVGGSRQTWDQCLARLTERGFAETADGSGYRLRFLDLYLAGDLHRSKRSGKLWADYQAEKDQRNERAEWQAMRPEAVAPPQPSGTKFAHWYLTEEQKAWHVQRIGHLIPKVSDPGLRNFDTDLDRA